MDVTNLARTNTGVRWNFITPMESYLCMYPAVLARRTAASILFWILPLLILAYPAINHAQAATPRVLIVKSGSASVYNSIVSAAKERVNRICSDKSNRCNKANISIKTVPNNNQLRGIAKDKKWDLIVAVGTKAAERLNRFKINTPILYSLIPSSSYPRIRGRSSSRHKSAIYIDQPIARQLKLIKSAMPGRKKVGVLLGNYSGIGTQSLKQLIRRLGLTPVVMRVSPKNIGNRLDNIYSRIDVLLALPDPSVYNKQSVLKVLLSSYRHRVPVIGYSAAFVKSGATAGIYSTPRNIGHHIGDEVAKFFSNNPSRFSPPAHPRYFTVNTNRRVINSINIKMPSRKTIMSKIRKAK